MVKIELVMIEIQRMSVVILGLDEGCSSNKATDECQKWKATLMFSYTAWAGWSSSSFDYLWGTEMMLLVVKWDIRHQTAAAVAALCSRRAINYLSFEVSTTPAADSSPALFSFSKQKKMWRLSHFYSLPPSPLPFCYLTIPSTWYVKACGLWV